MRSLPRCFCLWLPASFIKIWLKRNLLGWRQGQILAFPGTQGQLILTKIVWSGPNSNSSESLCLSWLSASLTKIQWKLNMLDWKIVVRCTSNNVSLLRHLKPSNSEVSRWIWPDFELVWFYVVLVICKLDEDLFKKRHDRVYNFFSGAQKRVTPKQDLARIWTCPRYYACPSYLQGLERSHQKWRRGRVHNIFTIITLWENVRPSTTKIFESSISIWAEF